jgi:hypothetical protein
MFCSSLAGTGTTLNLFSGARAHTHTRCEPGSSVSIVADYGLGDQDSIPIEAEDFSSLLCAQLAVVPT